MFLNTKAQNTIENTEGSVSFVTSQSVYVKYKSTEGILIGDTLFTLFNNKLLPSLIVKNLSTTSIVCIPLTTTDFVVNDKIIAKRRIKNKKPDKVKVNKIDTLLDAADSLAVNEKKDYNNKSNHQKIDGRMSVSSYNNFSNTPAKNSYVINYNLSLNIKNIGNSKFSLESNLLYRQENDHWQEVKKDVFNGLKIYGLALTYNFNKNSYLTFGRKINSNISNLGSIDGLQGEKSFKNLFVGGFVGSRPDYTNYGYNFNLLQYGAYFGHKLHTQKGNMRNTISVAEQTNNSNTDRRFLNFQHSNSLVKNLRVFYTLEADFYQLINGQKQSNFSLTNNYFSLSYQPFKRIRLSGTYDTRKNIIYYETYKNYINTLIANETRQGYGAQINYKISKSFNVGVRGGFRTQKNDIRITKNAYGFITYKNVFKSKLSTTFSTTLLETNYLNGNIYHIVFSRPFNSGKTRINLGYSFVNYRIQKTESPLIQHIVNINISRIITRKLYAALNFESNLETNIEVPSNYYRLYIRLTKRF